MKRITLQVAGCALALLLAGCGKQAAPSAATDLEKAFPPAAAPAPTTAAPAASQAPVKVEIAKAVAAIRKQEYGEAFLTLRNVQAAPNITVDQYSAIENARLAVEREVATKAAAGDPAALKALKAIQKTH